MGRYRVAFLIPVKDEEKTILKVINKLEKISDVIVVDDGSIDMTSKIVSQTNTKLIVNKKNIGYQKSIYKGIEFCKKKNYDYAITFDADGQHLNLDFKNLFNEINYGYDLIIAQRDRYNRFSEKLIRIYSKLFYNDIDLLSGVKAYKLAKINSLKYKFNTYCSELSINLLNRKAKFKKIPINILPRYGKPKIGSSFFINIRLILVLLYFFFYYTIKKS